MEVISSLELSSQAVDGRVCDAYFNHFFIRRLLAGATAFNDGGVYFLSFTASME